MLWKSGPILMCQFMWYAPGMEKGAVGPCIGTICFPSILTWCRVKWINLWPDLKIPPLILQCHLWIVCLLMQDHLGWSHQAQQVAHPRVVQINLPHLDVAPKSPGTDFHGGTRTLVCWKILEWPASGMHRLTYMSVCILCSLCIPFSGEVQCEMHSTCNILCLPSTTCFSIQGNTLNVTFEVDCWVGKGVDQRTFGPIATPLQEYRNPKQSLKGLRGVWGNLTQEIRWQTSQISRTIRIWALVHYIGR